MSQSALGRIQNLKSEDLFLSFDADEIPKPQVRFQKDQTFGITVDFFEHGWLKPVLRTADEFFVWLVT